jgi:hypothetical protein
MSDRFLVVLYPPAAATGPELQSEITRVITCLRDALGEAPLAVKRDLLRPCFAVKGPADKITAALDDACSSDADWLVVQAGPGVEWRGLSVAGQFLRGRR